DYYCCSYITNTLLLF
nr:immunoglobulin light chain junction region [Macaca mulatta]MOX29137.1 immunoglobulin light chain junction region [Macaca mulatta]MOX29621.1 immunoglobulin light chain junction region [Macaca mulatta]MOX31187.1 immunoglobulin light chain junction region [Macaca mulatta]MOX31437.1 immunoglobulin light chain junction region [Macaca mulatta]